MTKNTHKTHQIINDHKERDLNRLAHLLSIDNEFEYVNYRQLANNLANDPELVQHTIYWLFKKKEIDFDWANEVLTSLVRTDNEWTSWTDAQFLSPDPESVCVTALHLALIDKQPASSAAIRRLMTDFQLSMNQTAKIPQKKLSHLAPEILENLISLGAKADSDLLIKASFLAILFARTDLVDFLDFTGDFKFLLKVYDSIPNQGVRDCIDLVLSEMTKEDKEKAFYSLKIDVYPLLDSILSDWTPKITLLSDSRYPFLMTPTLYPVILESKNAQGKVFLLKKTKNEDWVRIGSDFMDSWELFRFFDSCNENGKATDLTPVILKILGEEAGLDARTIIQINLDEEKYSWTSFLIHDKIELLRLCLKHQIISFDSEINQNTPFLDFALEFDSPNIANLIVENMNLLKKQNSECFRP